MNIDQIIGKLMGDGSLEEERSTLEAWKKEAEENIKALEDIRKIAALSDSLHGYESFDSDAAWVEMESKFTAEQNTEAAVVSISDESTEEEKEIRDPKKEESNRVLKLGQYAKVAAVFVVLIGSLFLFKTMNDSGAADIFVSTEFKTEIGEKEEHLLEDGTKVFLDQKTKLRTKSDRSVSLKGRAFFDVAKDPNHQFSINMPIGKITVLGTRFTVIADNNTTEIYVEEGSVKYTLDGKDHIRTAGTFLRVMNGTVSLSNRVDENYTSWKSNKLTFNDNSMEEVVQALASHFGEEIELKDPKLFTNCNVVGVFENDSYTDVLNELKSVFGLKFEIQEGKTIIVSSEC